MAAAAPWRWNGAQTACLNEAWGRISDWDNLYSDDLYSGIPGVAGHVADPAMPADPTMRQEQADGWFGAEPRIQIAAGLVDIWVFWGSPCGEWAHVQHGTPGTYPLWTDITDPGWHGAAGRLNFDVTGGRLALDPETLEDLCGVPGEPAASPPPACTRITQATTWPAS
jgi:hypothetical protein